MGASTASTLDDATEKAITQAWDSIATYDTDFFFPSTPSGHPSPVLQPDPALAFRLWQVYLDNVNPLLKVTHRPTLQARFINFISSTDSTDKCLEALVFAIYCAAISTLDDDGCAAVLGPAISKRQGLAMYQPVCKQALVNCNFLWADTRDSLTALLLYLASIWLPINS